MSENYYRELSVGIMSGNYDLVYGKVEIYRDTGVSKNFVNLI
jgi:hypothetical protein